jgi:hypothetical protein
MDTRPPQCQGPAFLPSASGNILRLQARPSLVAGAGGGGPGEAVLGVFAERRDQPAAVVGAGGEHDVARVDVVQKDRGEVRMQATGAQAGRDDGDGLPGGDSPPRPDGRALAVAESLVSNEGRIRV